MIIAISTPAIIFIYALVAYEYCVLTQQKENNFVNLLQKICIVYKNSISLLI